MTMIRIGLTAKQRDGASVRERVTHMMAGLWTKPPRTPCSAGAVEQGRVRGCLCTNERMSFTTNFGESSCTW